MKNTQPLPKGSWFKTSFFPYGKNLGKCGRTISCVRPRIFLRKIKRAGESPGAGIFNFIRQYFKKFIKGKKFSAEMALNPSKVKKS